MSLKFLKNNLSLFLVLVGLAYAYGILSTEHFHMLGNSYYVGIVTTALVGFGVFFGIRAIDIERIGISTLTWLGLAIVIVIQPIIHTLPYVDMLVFPLGFLALASILSIVVVNVPTEKRLTLIQYVAWLFVITGLLSAITQFVQLIYPNHPNLRSVISAVSLPMARSTANLAQPNQASVVSVLAITALSYLFYRSHAVLPYANIRQLHKTQKKMLAFFVAMLFVLVAALTLTLSRTGLILLFIALFGVIFYPWGSHKVRFAFLGLSGVVSVLSYQLASQVGKYFFTDYQQQGETGMARLMATGNELRGILWDRAWDAFATNPVFGGGHGSYYGHGWDTIERWRWFENVDHSHNVISQIAAEFGLVGLLAMLGVTFVLLQKFIVFVLGKLKAGELFLCLMLVSFVAYSMAEFPLWYPFFGFAFVFLVALLDKGIPLKKIALKKPLIVFTIMISCVATFYAGIYRYYLRDYEIVLFASVDNQQKIDAYHHFPTIFGFSKAKDYMLHMIVDYEKTDNTEQLIALGERLLQTHVSLDVVRVQTKLLMQAGRQEEADKLNRRLCVVTHQQQVTNKQPFDKCAFVANTIAEIDPEDKMGYVKRLNEWYAERYGDE